MKLITTTTITISNENAHLIPVVVAGNGWKQPDETMFDAIKRIRNYVSFWNAIGQIVPHLQSFFWEQWKEQAWILELALKNWGITTTTEIIQDEDPA